MIGVNWDISEHIEVNNKLEETLLHLEKRVEERTVELRKTNHALRDEVMERKLISNKLIEKNLNITDSINYAKRIQLSLLTSSSVLAEIFPKSFKLSMPRDIVSGDFFWCHQRRNKKFIIVADCTGHGVPAALMTIIGNNLLNKIIIQENIESPSEILEILDADIKRALKGEETEIQDGMDISVCMIDTSFNELYFAGAYNSVFMQNLNGSIEVIASDRQSVGGGLLEGNKSFTIKRLPFTPGQRLYLSSDGFHSQFGGQKGKKFMKNRFVNTLADLHPLSIDKQKKQLQQVFFDWRGTLEQVDDVLVVGIEL